MTTNLSQPSAALLALAAQHCSAGAAKLADAALDGHLATLDGWSRGGPGITKTYAFADFHETIAFVNALAWIANREDHHPDLAVSYNRCAVTWSTHDAGGVTRNDVVCAAKTDRLLAG
jgi:4a-hydroxytetrahydrobiopterin dehydratase